MSFLLLAAVVAATTVESAGKPSSQVDFDYVCEMILPARVLAQLGGHVSFAGETAQSEATGTMSFTLDTTQQKLGRQSVAVSFGGAGFVGAVDQSNGVIRTFILDYRLGGNASLLIGEGTFGRKMLALGYCQISELNEVK